MWNFESRKEDILMEKYVYKLETHLKHLCDENREYENLLAAWHLNKKTCQEILKNVIICYPHFSSHDSSHSDTIISNIEMLLGEERIKTLSPTDTWLLLSSAYMHDLGMVILHRDINEHWQSNEFKSFWNEQKLSGSIDLQKRLNYIESLQDESGMLQVDFNWPVRVSTCVAHIIECFFRDKHSSLSREYLKKMKETLNTDFSHNGLIPNRLIHLLGEVSYSHTRNPEELLNLDYQTNGVDSDYAHPRFVAEMLRLGDLLDADASRFNICTELVVEEFPETSKLHKAKHQSTRHLLITPEEIGFRSDSESREVYREVRKWVTMLEDEVSFITTHWVDIVPKAFSGYAPKFRQKELLLKGKPDVDGTADLRFGISQEKAFDIIEGGNLYKDKYIFMREFVQNATDALKIQMWRDLKLGIYADFRNNSIDELSNLMPFDIPGEIYDNYKVHIEIKRVSNDETKVVISDNGIGISMEALKLMCKVGDSYNTRKKVKKEIDEMPSWLRPTGGFGIGMQSAFLVVDEFDIVTTTADGNSLKMKVGSRKTDGYIQVTEMSREEQRQRGTKIEILLNNNSAFSYTFGWLTDEYFGARYDPVMNENCSLSYKLADVVLQSCESNLFSIALEYENDKNDIPRLQIEENLKNAEDSNDYKFFISEDFNSIDMWTKEAGVYLRFGFMEKNHQYAPRNDVFFKGMTTDTSLRLPFLPHIRIEADIHGMNTKESLSLDRLKLTEKCLDTLNPLVENAVIFALNKMCEKIKTHSEIDKFEILSFLLSSNKLLADFNMAEYEHMFAHIDSEVEVLEKQPDGSFELEYIGLKTIMEQIPGITYMPYDEQRYPNTEHLRKVRINEIAKTLNGKVEDEIIVTDESVCKELSLYYTQKIRHIPFDDVDLFLINTGKFAKMLTVADDVTQEFLIKNFAENPANIDASFFRNRMKRLSVVAFSEYQGISTTYYVNSLAYGFKTPYRIISPITRDDVANIRGLSKEKFVESIINREDFKKLVDLVLCNKTEHTHNTKEEIIKDYVKLIEEYYDLNQ